MPGAVAVAGAGCVVPKLGPGPLRTGTSRDSLQDIIRPIERMKIVKHMRFMIDHLL